jgi:hypothetical protein
LDVAIGTKEYLLVVGEAKEELALREGAISSLLGDELGTSFDVDGRVRLGIGVIPSANE